MDIYSSVPIVTEVNAFKSFSETQIKRSLTPSCPIWIHEIKGDWLKNLLEFKPGNGQDFNALPVLNNVEEEQKKFFCPGCQEKEAPVQENLRTKAIWEWGHIFWINCYQKWGTDSHIWRRNEEQNIANDFRNFEHSIVGEEIKREEDVIFT